MSSEVQTCGKSIDSLLEKVLSVNILASEYFKELYKLKALNDVVDEIYNQVDHVEPWMTGNCRGPSTAFCLLYKLFTMKISVKQMQGILNHKDSPYIRALGFLYLRYYGDPKSIWQWFEPFIQDDEEFSPGSSGKMTTMGTYVRDLLLDQYYFDTLFPRIPVPISRQIKSHLERLKLPTAAQGVTGTGRRHGSEDTARRPPSVKAALSVSFGQRAPHRASTRDSSPVRRNMTSNGGQEDSSRREKDRDRKERDLGKDDRKERDYDRRDRDYDRRDRDRDYENRPRSREQQHDYRGRDRDYRDRRDSDHHDRDRRDRSPKRSKDRYRSRSRSPKRIEEKESSSKVSANLMKLRDLYGDASGKKDEERPRFAKDSNEQDVIRLGGTSWR